MLVLQVPLTSLINNLVTDSSFRIHPLYNPLNTYLYERERKIIWTYMGKGEEDLIIFLMGENAPKLCKMTASIYLQCAFKFSSQFFFCIFKVKLFVTLTRFFVIKYDFDNIHSQCFEILTTHCNIASFELCNILTWIVHCNTPFNSALTKKILNFLVVTKNPFNI